MDKTLDSNRVRIDLLNREYRQREAELGEWYAKNGEQMIQDMKRSEYLDQGGFDTEESIQRRQREYAEGRTGWWGEGHRTGQKGQTPPWVPKR